MIVPNVAHLLKWQASSSANIASFTIVTTEIDSYQYTPSANISAGDGWLCVYGATTTSKNKLSVVSKNSSVTIKDTSRI